MKLFKSILGKFGLGEDEYPENLDRFDLTPLTKDAKIHKEKVEAEKGKPPVKRKRGRPKKTQ